jgi:SAM-dependent methyltransferase
MSKENILKLPPLFLKVPAAKIPAWNMSSLIHRNCPVCDNDHVSIFVIRPDNLKVGKCLNCGMVYVPDIPSREDIEAFYLNYSDYKGYQPQNCAMLRRILNRFLNKDHHILILEKTGGIKGKRLCEVGCSFGNFLFEAKRAGAEVYGVELDSRAIYYLTQKGIRCTKEIDNKSEFDIICAFQLIEHLPQPAEFIKKVSKHLAFGGRLLLSLPNGAEIDDFGPTWIGFRVDLEHLNYFSVKTLSILLSQYGLYIEHYWTYNQPSIWFTDEKRSPIERLLEIRKHFLLKSSSLPFYTDGNFVLTILARKIDGRDDL